MRSWRWEGLLPILALVGCASEPEPPATWSGVRPTFVQPVYERTPPPNLLAVRAPLAPTRPAPSRPSSVAPVPASAPAVGLPPARSAPVNQPVASRPPMRSAPVRSAPVSAPPVNLPPAPSPVSSRAYRNPAPVSSPLPDLPPARPALADRPVASLAPMRSAPVSPPTPLPSPRRTYQSAAPVSSSLPELPPARPAADRSMASLAPTRSAPVSPPPPLPSPSRAYQSPAPVSSSLPDLPPARPAPVNRSMASLAPMRSAPVSPGSMPGGMATFKFSKGYRSNWFVAASQIYMVSKTGRCEDLQSEVKFRLGSAEQKILKSPGNGLTTILAGTDYTYSKVSSFNISSMIGTVAYTNTHCQRRVTFTPVAGHQYAVVSRSVFGGQCDIDVIDEGSGRAPADLDVDDGATCSRVYERERALAKSERRG